VVCIGFMGHGCCGDGAMILRIIWWDGKEDCLLSQSHGCGHDRDLILRTSTAFSFVVLFWWIAMGETLQFTDWAILLLSILFADGGDSDQAGSGLSS
jgi:hypothetical protein